MMILGTSKFGESEITTDLIIVSKQAKQMAFISVLFWAYEIQKKLKIVNCIFEKENKIEFEVKQINDAIRVMYM